MILPVTPIKYISVIFPKITYICQCNINFSDFENLRNDEERKKYLTRIKQRFIDCYVELESDVPIVKFDYEHQTKTD